MRRGTGGLPEAFSKLDGNHCECKSSIGRSAMYRIDCRMDGVDIVRYIIWRRGGAEAAVFGQFGSDDMDGSVQYIVMISAQQYLFRVCLIVIIH